MDIGFAIAFSPFRHTRSALVCSVVVLSPLCKRANPQLIATLRFQLRVKIWKRWNCCSNEILFWQPRSNAKPEYSLFDVWHLAHASLQCDPMDSVEFCTISISDGESVEESLSSHFRKRELILFNGNAVNLWTWNQSESPAFVTRTKPLQEALIRIPTTVAIFTNRAPSKTTEQRCRPRRTHTNKYDAEIGGLFRHKQPTCLSLTPHSAL